MMTGIIRAGYVCFVISPRNSAPAVVHLLKTTGCGIVFTSNDSAMQSLIGDALEGLESPPSVGQVPGFSELYKDDEAGFERLPAFHLPNMDVPILICHSSGMRTSVQLIIQIMEFLAGSTSFPKPIKISHRNICHGGLLQCKCLSRCSLLALTSAGYLYQTPATIQKTHSLGEP